MSGAPEAHRAALAHLWAYVEASLDDEQVHQKFVRFAVDHELYLPAIERYKALAIRSAAHRALAERMQKAIAGQAAAKVFAKAAREAPRRRGVVQALVVLGLIGAGVTLLLRAC